MAKVRTKNKGGSRKRNSQDRTRKEKRRAKRLRQQRHYRQMRSVNIGRAARDPKPTPRARGYLAAQFWKRFRLGEALEEVGVFKDGLPLGHILLVVMLFGLLNATSLAHVVQEVNQDVVLRAILDIEGLEVKQVYRGLARLTVIDYQAWMGVFLRELQKDPRTASRREGVLIGDGTQKRRSYSRKRGRGARWLRVIYLHGEKRFDYGYEIESTHYADLEKDFPLLSAIHELSAEREAEIKEARQRKSMGLDLRRTADRVTWLKHLIERAEDVEWVELGARDLNTRMRQEVEAAQVDWVGVSGQRRVYHLKGRAKPQPAKTLLKIKRSQKWLGLPDVGYHLLWLDAAECTLGTVVLVIAEHLASGHRQLYVLPPQAEEEALERVTRVLVRDLETADESRLDLMADLVDQSVQAGIQAETGVFDRGYFSVRFILQVLKVGLKRVIIPAKKGVHYSVTDTIYDLPDLWSLLTDSDFQTVANEHRSYQIASLQATVGDLGLVQLIFVRQLSRHQKTLRSFVLVCTDVQFAPAAALQAYLLRWRIEVGYREVKQNHAFGRTLSAKLEEVYGQLVLSFLAYTCLSVTRLLTARLQDKTLGWIKREYFNARVEFQIAADGALTILFPPWLLDSFGLPDY